jgi:hypothetical protein
MTTAPVLHFGPAGIEPSTKAYVGGYFFVAQFSAEAAATIVRLMREWTQHDVSYLADAIEDGRPVALGDDARDDVARILFEAGEQDILVAFHAAFDAAYAEMQKAKR